MPPTGGLPDSLELLAGAACLAVPARQLDALLERGEKLAASGYTWVQFTEDGRSCNGAMLYMGDEPVHSRMHTAAQG